MDEIRLDEEWGWVKSPEERLLEHYQRLQMIEQASIEIQRAVEKAMDGKYTPKEFDDAVIDHENQIKRNLWWENGER